MYAVSSYEKSQEYPQNILEPKVQVEQGYLVFVFCALPIGSSATVNRMLTTLAGTHGCKESSDVDCIQLGMCAPVSSSVRGDSDTYLTGRL